MDEKKIKFGKGKEEGEGEVVEEIEETQEDGGNVEKERGTEEAKQQLKYCLSRVVNLCECGQRAIETGFPLNVVPDDVIALRHIVEIVASIPEDVLFSGSERI